MFIFIFLYTFIFNQAKAPNDINFVPLLPSHKSFNAKELLDYYRDKSNEDGKHIKPYTDIIYDAEKYPVIYDNNGNVMSLPPIINGNHSKMSMHTKNVFIECTATDANKAKIVLNVSRNIMRIILHFYKTLFILVYVHIFVYK